MNITAKSFSGQYGTPTDVGDIIHVHIESPYSPISNPVENELMFLIDVSASMQDSLPMVKSSLLAFRDAILHRTPSEMAQLSPDDRDRMFRENIKVRLITFSNEATEVWSSDNSDIDDYEYFEDVVIGLKTVAMTNMGDALKLAFELSNPDLFTWIAVMTDGESNEGPCRTADAFQRLVVTSQPLNTKVITIGYGSRFDPEVLDRVGNFVYVEDAEMIPVVLGNVAEEIMTTIGFNCVVDIEGTPLPSEFDDDTIIVAAGESEVAPGKVIVGDRVLGTICMGECYDYVYLPHGNNCLPGLNGFNQVKIQYTDVHTRETTEMIVDIEHTRFVPTDSIRGLYFDSEKKRLIYKLYKLIHKSKNQNQKVKRIQKQIEDWEDPISYPHKDQITKIIQDMDTGPSIHRASTALNCAIGTGYADSGRRSAYLDTTLRATNHYLESPLISNNNDN